MPRCVASRLVLPGFACCYHITQRCQEHRHLLRHAKDRRQYLKRLWETSGRYPISVLNYMITSNHVHLLTCLECADAADFSDWYVRTLNEERVIRGQIPL
jgi:putative transposase